MGYPKIIYDIIADAVRLLKRYDMINGIHSGDAPAEIFEERN